MPEPETITLPPLVEVSTERAHELSLLYGCGVYVAPGGKTYVPAQVVEHASQGIFESSSES